MKSKRCEFVYSGGKRCHKFQMEESVFCSWHKEHHIRRERPHKMEVDTYISNKGMMHSKMSYGCSLLNIETTLDDMPYQDEY